MADKKAFRSVFTAHNARIKNYIYYRTGQLPLAEDLTQEVFLNAWEKWSGLQEETLIPYLYAIARNLIINNARRSTIELRFQQKETPLHDSESPEYVMEMQEFDRLVQKAISLLPEKQRSSFLMNRIDRLTFREIAEIERISVKAVEKRVKNALDFLFEKIKYKL
jgi:RNA polymerase sigma-70 factor (ECF subfamily)